MKLKLMPMLVGTLALTLAATPVVFKAEANTSGQQLLAQGQRQDRFAERLNLTQAQKDQIAQIRQKKRSQIEALLTQEQRNAFKAARENNQERRAAIAAINLTSEQKTKMREIMRSAKSEFQSVLNPQQQQQFQQIIQERRQQRNQNQSQKN
jgi:Spy/CpxP family protein refolding chaperone